MSKPTDPTILTKPTLSGATTTAEAALAFAEGAVPAALGTKAPAGGNRAFFAPDGYRRLTINLPEALHKKLKLAAVERDCTATAIIEALLLKELGGS